MPLIGSKKIASMKILAVSFTQLQSQAKIFVLLFFSAVLVLGINIYQDFGISFDEAAHRERGIVTLNYIGDLWGIKAIKTDPILTKFRSLPPLNLYLVKSLPADFVFSFGVTASASFPFVESVNGASAGASSIAGVTVSEV